jgi:hypothetical protein
VDAEQLTLRKMTFDGIPYDDDWLVIWRGLAIGRILKQSGITMGVPNWFWGINMSGMPQPAHWKGNGAGLADCQRQFKAAWARVRAGLSDEEIEAWRQRDAATEKRLNNFRS